jgi:hypothetical protein
MSTCMWEKGVVGTVMACVSVAGCLVILALLQGWQALHHVAMSVANCGHTYLLEISLHVERIPRWARLWTASKIWRLKDAGTSGRRTPDEVSTRIYGLLFWSSPGSCMRIMFSAGDANPRS